MSVIVPDQQLRPDIEMPPPRIAKLPVHRGYPVPWFVAWIDGQPEFRAMDADKFKAAIRQKLCWVCGEPLGKFKVFLIGPMCGINRTSAEPPNHLDCARYSAKNCPFLSKPHMVRRENNLPAHGETAGFAILRNPGASLLWTTKGHSLFGDGKGGILFDIGEPLAVEWYYESKAATRAQVEHSVETGLPLLMDLAQKESPAAVAELLKRHAWIQTIYPRA